MSPDDDRDGIAEDDGFDTLLARFAATPKQRPPLEVVGPPRFELVRRLGAGGFGDVYEARDREHGTRVALKSLRTPSAEWLYRFKREFRVVADLTHPNLARLHELSCVGDSWYLTMELVDGIPLDQHLARAPGDLRSCFAQLAVGVAALHRAGCLHRDLKPSNALVEPGGRLVILDFGLAIEHGGPLHTVVAGTPPFMAPELIAGGEPSPACDWYAFGVMLYTALAGRMPFVGTEAEQQERKQRGDAPPPSSLRADVDPVLERLALDLLDPDPTRRPGDAELLAALDVPVPTVAPGSGRGDADLVGREPELAALAGALADARAGRAVVATVHGAPGIGRTSLLAAFARRARADGAAIYQGRCHEAESVPFKGLDGVIDALCSDLARRDAEEVDALVPAGAAALADTFPVLERLEVFARARRRDGRGGGDDVRRAAIGTLRALLGRMAARGPIALVVDDAQWMSEDTVRCLSELVGPGAPGALVVVSYRQDARGASPALDALVAALDAAADVGRVDLEVGPLDDAAVAAVVAARAPDAVDPERAARVTGGHPQLLARLLDARGGDLDALLAEQLARLPVDARALLEVVAIASAPVAPAIAFAAAGVRRSPAVIDVLRRERLVHVLAAGGDARIAVYHARVREAAMVGMTAARREALSARIAGGG